MIVSLEARNFELTEAISSRVEKMINGQLKVYIEKITKVTVILDYVAHRKGDQPNADVKIVVEIAGPDVVASNKHDDLYEAVDGALDKAVDQIQKSRDK